MNLLVLGWFHSNIGDLSYQKTFQILFPHDNLVFSSKLTEEQINESDTVVLGGGNVLKPYFFKELNKVHYKPIYAISVGLEDAIEVPKIFKHLSVRDKFSFDELKKQGHSVSSHKDLAFLLQPEPEKGKEWIVNKFKESELDLYKRVVVVVVNAYLIHGGQDGYSRDSLQFINFSYNLARIIDSTPASFVFLPMDRRGLADDRVSNTWVAHKCKFWKKNLVIYDELSVQETLNIVSASDMVISTRLHSSIFSKLSGVNFVDIVHHSKNERFLETINKDYLSYWNIDYQKLSELLHDPVDCA